MVEQFCFSAFLNHPFCCSVRGMWQQSGHLVFLPVKHVTIWPQEQPNVMRMYEQPVSYRMSVLWCGSFLHALGGFTETLHRRVWWPL